MRILAFDVFGTVVDWRSGIVAAGQRLSTRGGVDADWPALADAWREGYQPAMERIRRGEAQFETLDRIHRSILDGLLPRFGLDRLSEDDRAELVWAWRRLRPWPDAIEGLTRLRHRYVVAALSNGNVSLLTEMAKHTGLPWDCILSAELVRRYKPDPEVYLQVPRFFDLAPEQVLMVAAHVWDLEGAKAAGLRTAFVHRPRERGPNALPPTPEPGAFDYEARDFLDLARQLEA